MAPKKGEDLLVGTENETQGSSSKGLNSTDDKLDNCGDIWLGMIAGILSGVSIALASFSPGTVAGAVLGMCAAVSLTFTVYLERRVIFSCYIGGVIFHLLAFYWIPQTLQSFGGFPFVIACALFVLYAGVSALQFMLFGWMALKLRRFLLGAWGVVAVPLAWFAAESLVPRFFPWMLAHTVLAWKDLSSLGEYGGAPPVSFLMMSMASAFLLGVKGAKSVTKLARFIGCGLLLGLVLCALWVGRVRDDYWAKKLAQGNGHKVAIVQGNLDLEEKRDVSLLSANLERYRNLTKLALEAEPGLSLIVWPESVVIDWMPIEQKQLASTRYDPFPQLTVPLLYGGLSFEPRSVEDLQRYRDKLGASYGSLRNLRYRRFNSAIVRGAEGEVLGVFHKKVLMPLGEYLPFEETFPQVRALSPYSGDFSPGKNNVVIAVPDRMLPDVIMKVGPLICYEDIVPEMAAESVRGGANLLVNITNDAWYGNTHAPYQHNLLASWRAIENRRFLIRSTNTGFTSVVDPRGEITNTLPIFSEGFTIAELGLFDELSIFTKFGELPGRSISILILILCLFVGARSKKSSSYCQTSL